MSNDLARKKLWSLLGDLPDMAIPIKAHTLSVKKNGTMIVERLVLDLNGLEQAPALFIYPSEKKSPAPAILYHHMHAGRYDRGKMELLEGHEYMGDLPPWAEVIVSLGWSALAIDSWCFGERHGELSESETFKLMLWQGRVMWGMMVFDSLRALDYLASRDEVDPHRIASLGMSMGSTMAWWTAALDERIKACVDICCMTDFETLIEEKGLDQHGLYYYVPRLLKDFSTARINALTAPRPHLSLVGINDPLTPASGLNRIDEYLRREYKTHGVPEAWHLERHDSGHEETAGMRQSAIDFLKRTL